MELDDLSTSRDYREKYNAALRRIQKLEQEHASLLELNDIFKQELEQKTTALKKSSSDYAALKKQYEELLNRVTELHLEHQLNQSTPSPDRAIVDSLRSQIQKLSIRKTNFKSQAARLRQRVESLETDLATLRLENSEWTRTYSVCLGFISPPRIDASPPQIVADVVKRLAEANRVMVSRARYDRLQSKYRSALDNCDALASKIKANREAMAEGIKIQQMKNRYSLVNRELVKMQRYLSKYEEQCQHLEG
jgi:chromosome segregation ATPase